MTKLLLGGEEEKKLIDAIEDEIELEVYSDEIFRVNCSLDNSKWIYLGILFIPSRLKNDCIAVLQNSRCVAHNDWHDSQKDCKYKCGYHEKNNTEIHYTEVDRTDARYKIACNWIKNAINVYCTRYPKFLYFNILGINLTNMNLEMFGRNRDRDLTIYNRFYRTALMSGINYFFPKQKCVIVSKIFHDKGCQETHKLFPWHAIHKLNLEDKRIMIKPTNIEFIDSDHRISLQKESHLIQFIDIILGATHVCLDIPSEKDKKKAIGLLFKPALEKMLDRRKNLNTGSMFGRYYKSRYYRTYQVSFFPKNKIKIDDALYQLNLDGGISDSNNDKDNFYYDRPINLQSLLQKSLENF